MNSSEAASSRCPWALENMPLNSSQMSNGTPRMRVSVM